LLETFGLGEGSEASTAWPVDDGDRAFQVDVTGAIEATLLLAVNDEVAGRLSSDPTRLAAGFKAAVEAMAATQSDDESDAEISISEAELVEAESIRPEITVEIKDNDRLSAIVGLIPRVVEGADAPDDQAGPAGSADRPFGASAGSPDGNGSFVPQPFGAEHFGVSVAAGPLSLLQDVDMEVTVELGRTNMPIRELLALQPGMVVEIDRAASAPIDVLVNGRRIACGEVVVIDEEFGIRITEIVTSGDHH
jgi:flagellar motor switch protein FliN/FliY